MRAAPGRSRGARGQAGRAIGPSGAAWPEVPSRKPLTRRASLSFRKPWWSARRPRSWTRKPNRSLPVPCVLTHSWMRPVATSQRKMSTYTPHSTTQPARVSWAVSKTAAAQPFTTMGAAVRAGQKMHRRTARLLTRAMLTLLAPPVQVLTVETIPFSAVPIRTVPSSSRNRKCGSPPLQRMAATMVGVWIQWSWCARHAMQEYPSAACSRTSLPVHGREWKEPARSTATSSASHGPSPRVTSPAPGAGAEGFTPSPPWRRAWTPPARSGRPLGAPLAMPPSRSGRQSSPAPASS
mmetsp:Transcript_38941/g.121659  ORF Transcript_38941/g.121659 Transcript_38941/m.121659 type:complete len:294 (+) Transcript_38941:234-1115(+)